MSAIDVDLYAVLSDPEVAALPEDARKLYVGLLHWGRRRGGTFRRASQGEVDHVRRECAVHPDAIDELVAAGLLFFADSDPAERVRLELASPTGELAADDVRRLRVYEVLTPRERDGQRIFRGE